MKPLKTRCREVFPKSRKLQNIEPSDGQLDNIVHRLGQIFTEDEVKAFDEKMLVRQVERVWPIARYIDKK